MSNLNEISVERYTLKPTEDRLMSENNTDGGCQYIMIRGARKGARCGRPVEVAGNLCKSCSSKKTVSSTASGHWGSLN